MISNISFHNLNPSSRSTAGTKCFRVFDVAEEQRFTLMACSLLVAAPLGLQLSASVFSFLSFFHFVGSVGVLERRSAFTS
eukprot:m.9343 g.9343  ORF g.9343 m.9343 type:complete len:80 (+) comp5400_c0_seq1:352-591(+)